MKVFIDTNVLLDVILNRKPFVHHSRLILEAAEQKKIRLYTSSISLLNVHYIVASSRGERVAQASTLALRNLLDITRIDQLTIDEALRIESVDFEDAVQFISAKPDYSAIITRDYKGFKSFDLPVYSPSEFLNVHASSW